MTGLLCLAISSFLSVLLYTSFIFACGRINVFIMVVLRFDFILLLQGACTCGFGVMRTLRCVYYFYDFECIIMLIMALPTKDNVNVSIK